MKFIVLIMLLFISGCATLTQDTTINNPSDSSWKIKNRDYGYYSLHYKCNEGSSASVIIDEVLSKKGKLYFIFFLLPIHTAKLFDKPYSGLKIVTKFPGQHQGCSRNDVYLNIDEKKLQPNTAEKSRLNNSNCEYTWSPRIKENGNFSISFENLKQCKAPPISFKYETKINYNYDKFAP